MEINTYNLRKDNDEFKDLTENQLMVIAELCMKYYKKGFNSAGEDVQQDLQDEVDDLERQLEDSDYEYHRLEQEYEELDNAFNELKDKYNELKNEKKQ